MTEAGFHAVGDRSTEAATSAGRRVSDVGEQALIERLRERLPPPAPWVTVGPGDDAAVIEPARNRLEVLSCDALVEGVHFDRSFVPPAAIGHRALAVNLSDLAAMGAEPRGALLSLMLPPAMTLAEFDGLVDGFLALARRCHVVLLGGNLSRSPGPLIVDVTVVGAVGRRQVLRRAGARPGDEIWVSGVIGSAAAGLQSLQGGEETGRDEGLGACQARYRFPEPRIRLGLVLGRTHAATACMDLSDGLADAVTQVARASGVGMSLDAAAVPVAVAARDWFIRAGADPIEAALAGGDDYELLFTVRPRFRGRLSAARRQAGDVQLTRIGAVTAGRAVVLRRGAIDTPLPGGFAHFR